MGFKTPILLITWRRANTTKKVIDAIRKHKPERIFIHSDGPRKEIKNDKKKVEETRSILNKEIDWPCEIKKFYRKKNVGLYEGGSAAISWFFESVEEGIILEDDTVPSYEFLPFCETLLNKYRDDERIWCIRGSNFQNNNWRGDASYYFSRCVGIWGWATWKRCWNQFDKELKNWPAFKDINLINSMIEDPVERKYWEKIWDNTFKDPKSFNTWDYQWEFACRSNSGLTISPNVNLVKNIGYGKDATHTLFENRPTSIDKKLGEIKHPKFILRNRFADRFEFDFLNGGKQKRSILFYLLNLPKKIHLYFLAKKIKRQNLP